MNNLTFGKDNFTKTAADKVTSSASETKKSEITEKALISALEKTKKDLEKIISGCDEIYENYAANEMSTAINSLEMVDQTISRLLEKVKQFGK
jgi:hypothetical protein